MHEFAWSPRSLLPIFLGWSRSGFRTEHECHNLQPLRNILAEPRLPAASRQFLPTVVAASGPIFPSAAYTWPSAGPYLLFLLGQCTLVDDRAPATSSTSPDTSRVSSDIPGVASQPSYQLPWAPTGGLLLLIGHRSPLGSPSLPLLLLIPTTLPLGQRGGKVVPYVAAAH